MFADEFSAKIWADKYQYKGETFSGFCHRISSNIFPDDDEREKDLNALLLDFRVMFGGRINSNIGVDEQGLTLFNCYIESINKNPDSLEGIMEMITNYVLTLKTEGGVGFCADFFRPSKTIIRKIGVASPGSIKFLEMFDKASEIITSGSVDKDDCYQGTPTKNSIRKGATMVTMSCSHPDIEEFITAKSTPNKLTKMNMSVLVTDDFMDAVKSDSDWDLWFPDINFERYDTEWDGNLGRWKKKGNPIIVYKTIRATDLWDLIMKSSFNRNEPGILFIDNARKMNNISYLNGDMLSSNPCGEVIGVTGIEYVDGEPVELGDVCNLGSINLPKFYDAEENKFCVTEFKEAVDVMVRSLENIIDISGYPLDIYEKAAKLKRKIGIGVMGVGSLMMMMNLRYGSEECIDVLGAIMSEFINQAYKSSALLAKDKGPFKLYSPELLDLGYVKHGKLNKDTVDLIKKYGLRHSALSAIAPNGTLSIVAGNVSGGVEPVFAKEFSRWNRVEGKSVDFKYPNIHKGEWFETDYLKEDKVADEMVLYSTDGKYRIDKNTGLCERVTIMDYGYRIAKEKGYTETATAMELNVDEHLNVLRLLSSYVDQSSSKCIEMNHRIYTDKGLKKIGDLSACRKPDTFEKIDGVLNVRTISGIKNVNNFYYNGFVNGKKVITSNGMELSGSSVHRIKVLDKDFNLIWKSLSDVKVGDITPIQLREDISSELTISKILNCTFKKPKNCMPINIPTQLNSSLLWWLGCVYADGNVNSLGVHLTQVGGTVLDKFVDVSKELFGFNVVVVRDERRANLFKASINSKVLSEWMDYIGFSKGEISEIVFCATPLMKKSFVEGMTLDGYISDITVCLKTDKSLKIIKDLQLICLAVGIPTYYRANYNKDYDRYYYDLYVSPGNLKSMSSFIFPEPHKQDMFRTLYNARAYNSRNVYDSAYLRFPISESMLTIVGNIEKKVSTSGPLYNVMHRIFSDAKKHMSLTLEQLFVVFNLNGEVPLPFTEKYLFTEVSEVEDVEIETADIEVDEEHNYVVDGFLSHNTINLPNNITLEDFKSLYGQIHSYGIKGCTTYREGTSVAVLEVQKKEKEKSVKVQQQEFLEAFRNHEKDNTVMEDVKLPEEYPAKGYIIKSEGGRKFYLHVAFKDVECTKPFALFVNTNNKEDNVLTFNALEKLEEIAVFHNLRADLIEDVKRKYANQKNQVKICRMLGFLLRHNVDVYTIVKGFDELEAGLGTFVFRIKKFLSQFVEDHEVEGMVCPECGEKSIIFTEGCMRCTQCGGSKCG